MGSQVKKLFWGLAWRSSEMGEQGCISLHGQDDSIGVSELIDE